MAVLLLVVVVVENAATQKQGARGRAKILAAVTLKTIVCIVRIIAYPTYNICNKAEIF